MTMKAKASGYNERGFWKWKITELIQIETSDNKTALLTMLLFINKENNYWSLPLVLWHKEAKRACRQMMKGKRMVWTFNVTKLIIF